MILDLAVCFTATVATVGTGQAQPLWQQTSMTYTKPASEGVQEARAAGPWQLSHFHTTPKANNTKGKSRRPGKNDAWGVESRGSLAGSRWVGLWEQSYKEESRNVWDQHPVTATQDSCLYQHVTPEANHVTHGQQTGWGWVSGAHVATLC